MKASHQELRPAPFDAHSSDRIGYPPGLWSNRANAECCRYGARASETKISVRHETHVEPKTTGSKVTRRTQSAPQPKRGICMDRVRVIPEGEGMISTWGSGFACSFGFWVSRDAYVPWQGGTASWAQLLNSNVQWFRGGIVSKAHILVYYSTLGLSVLKRDEKERLKNGSSSWRKTS